MLYIANMASKIHGVKKLLKPIYYSYKNRIYKNRNELFKSNALTVLKAFDELMAQYNIPYSVFAGTMLGAIREKGFIKHDLDLDVTVFYSDRPLNMTDIMRSAGFKLIKYFTVDGGKHGLEETYEMDGVTLDIFYVHYDENGCTYQCDFHSEGLTSWEHAMIKYGHIGARKLAMPVSRELIRVPFEDISVNVMSNYDEWLRCRYGNDYMIPNPDFHDTGMNAYIIERWRDAVYNVFD